MNTKNETILLWYADIKAVDVALVGGKNASLGEMISTMKEQEINVPDGFATTAYAYRLFLAQGGLDTKIREALDRFHQGKATLETTGKSIRRLMLNTEFPKAIADPVRAAYRELSQRYGVDDVDVAVRSSATAEDLPEASFAGQHESYLNISGEDDLIDACRRCYASLFTDRAIVYREQKGFDHMSIALSAGIQKMVRSDLAGSGVMFSIDTDSGFPDVVVINAAWGLGENVVQGAVNPDEYRVFKPLLANRNLCPIIEKELGSKEEKMVYATGGSKTTKNEKTTREERNAFVLTDDEILQLSNWAVLIEKHYGEPMDMEWARDGQTGTLSIVQARPETVQSRKQSTALKSFRLNEKGTVIAKGIAIGEAIAAGKAQVIESPRDIDRFKRGSILITSMTDPDWVPIMKQAAGIITDHGGRTSHAAIVSRELGLPAVVGTGSATDKLRDGMPITLSCAEGEDGIVYDGELDFTETDIDIDSLPKTRTDIMMNIATPSAALRWWRLPARGIGLARMEFIINNIIKIHPMALLNVENLRDREARRQIDKLTRNYANKAEYFVDHLSKGIAMIAASQYPHKVLVRMSDFKTNEYANLIGGKEFEPKEENPMLGFRGASRYYNPNYRPAFDLECQAVKKAREEIGLDNIMVMIPFCRTVKEADNVIQVMESNGLKRGENGLKLYVMCEIPSNVILADEFAQRFDGFSIGSNDLTQLVLGVDRDNDALKEIFDERNEAVETFIEEVIVKAHNHGTTVGICGQAPSDYPEFTAFLVRCGIDSISLNPDSVPKMIDTVASIERSISGHL